MSRRQGTGSILIVCDAESHAPRIATVGKINTGRHGVLLDRHSTDREYLVDDEPVAERDLFGTSTTGPKINASSAASHRGRRVFECPLCGLRVEMRQEKVDKLAAAGVFRVGLPALSASL